MEIYENQSKFFDFRIHFLFPFLSHFLFGKRRGRENKKKKEEEREKGRKTKTAGYSGAFSGITSHPTEFGVSCSVTQLCRLIRRTFLFKKLNQ